MIKQALVAVAGLMALSACSPAASEDAGTPDAPAQAAFGPAEMSAMVAADGAEATVQVLLATPGDPRWEAFLAGLSAGEPGWLDVVPSLRDALDGEAAESVYSALAEGLAANAEGVLRAAGTENTESVCWNEASEDDAAASASNARRVAAVEAIDADGPLAAQRDECLTWLSGEPT